MQRDHDEGVANERDVRQGKLEEVPDLSVVVGSSSGSGATQTSLSDLQVLQTKLGYTFKNIFLLVSALDRTKLNKEGDGNTTPDYEALEFLGDRVINLFAAACLVIRHQDADPSTLHDFYVAFTRNTGLDERGSRLYRIAEALDLASLINTRPDSPLTAYGEKGKNRNKKRKTEEQKLADHVEALFGAIFLDCKKDMEVVERIFEQLFRRWLRSEDHHTVCSSVDSEETELGGGTQPTVPERLSRVYLRGVPSAQTQGVFTSSRTGIFQGAPSRITSLPIHALFLSLIRHYDAPRQHALLLEELESRVSDFEKQVIQHAKSGSQSFFENSKEDVSILVFNICFYFSVKERKTNLATYFMKERGGEVAKEVFKQCLIISNNNQAVYGFLKSREGKRYDSLEELCSVEVVALDSCINTTFSLP